MKTPACLSHYPHVGPSNDWSVDAWEVTSGVFVCFDDSIGQWCTVKRDIYSEDSTVQLGAFDDAESAIAFAKDYWQAIAPARLPFCSESVRAGARMLYDDGRRPGFLTVLECDDHGMLVQFDDNASPTRIQYRSPEWTDYLFHVVH